MSFSFMTRLTVGLVICLLCPGIAISQTAHQEMAQPESSFLSETDQAFNRLMTAVMPDEEAEFKLLRDQRSALAAEISQLQADVQRYENDLADIPDKRRLMEERLNHTNIEAALGKPSFILRDVKEEKQTILRRYQSLKLSVDQVEKQITEIDRKLANQQAQQLKIQTEFQKTQHRLTQIQIDLIDLRTEQHLLARQSDQKEADQTILLQSSIEKKEILRDAVAQQLSDLRNQQEKHQNDLGNLEKTRAFLQETVSPKKQDVIEIEAELTTIKLRISEEEQNQKQQLAEYEALKQRLTAKLDALNKQEINLTDKLTAAKQVIDQKGRRLSVLENEINILLIPRSAKDDFKFSISVIFALLVGAVIFFFFRVSLKDEIVRRMVFSAEAGIQFVTLFSLVIAIILFGITGILEGKELSALLGGISGYILGRATPKLQNQNSEKAAQ